MCPNFPAREPAVKLKCLQSSDIENQKFEDAKFCPNIVKLQYLHCYSPKLVSSVVLHHHLLLVDASWPSLLFRVAIEVKIEKPASEISL